MTTIAYDKPVVDFIAQLSATGHVTHTAYKKTSVTLHHNGGRLSHQGVLNVWKVRPASAHFSHTEVTLELAQQPVQVGWVEEHATGLRFDGLQQTMAV